MTDERADKTFLADRDFVRQVTAKAARKLLAQKNGEQTVWSGLGMSGLVGWSVAVPTVDHHQQPVIRSPRGRQSTTHVSSGWVGSLRRS